MPRFIHAAVINSAIHFREWSTVVDAYTTDVMTYDEAVRYCVDRHQYTEADAKARIDRTAIVGTSSLMGDTRSIDDGWDVEACGECGRFHHAFDAKFNGRCFQCGELEEDGAHEPPCVKGAE